MSQPLRIPEAYGTGRFGLSIEIFPPKTPEGDAGLRQSLGELLAFQPAFVSCTYGAGGSTSTRTLDWCRSIQEDFRSTATAHFTCVGSTRAQLIEWLQAASAAGIRNIMALRGDPPAGTETFRPVDGGLQYASELVALIRSEFPELGIGVGGYPEKHPEASSAEADLQHLAQKVAAGADAIYTQLFFDNASYYRFREACQRVGVTVPIVPGIMPITEFARIRRITALCGARLPDELATQLEAAQHDAAAQYQIGVDFAIRQCQDLIAQGVPGLHLYALNKSQACREILHALGFDARPAA